MGELLISPAPRSNGSYISRSSPTDIVLSTPAFRSAKLILLREAVVCTWTETQLEPSGMTLDSLKHMFTQQWSRSYILKIGRGSRSKGTKVLKTTDWGPNQEPWSTWDRAENGMWMGKGREAWKFGSAIETGGLAWAILELVNLKPLILISQGRCIGVTADELLWNGRQQSGWPVALTDQVPFPGTYQYYIASSLSTLESTDSFRWIRTLNLDSWDMDCLTGLFKEKIDQG